MDDYGHVGATKINDIDDDKNIYKLPLNEPSIADQNESVKSNVKSSLSLFGKSEDKLPEFKMARFKINYGDTNDKK